MHYERIQYCGNFIEDTLTNKHVLIHIGSSTIDIIQDNPSPNVWPGLQEDISKVYFNSKTIFFSFLHVQQIGPEDDVGHRNISAMCYGCEWWSSFWKRYVYYDFFFFNIVLGRKERLYFWVKPTWNEIKIDEITFK